MSAPVDTAKARWRAEAATRPLRCAMCTLGKVERTSFVDAKKKISSDCTYCRGRGEVEQAGDSARKACRTLIPQLCEELDAARKRIADFESWRNDVQHAYECALERFPEDTIESWRIAMDDAPKGGAT